MLPLPKKLTGVGVAAGGSGGGCTLDEAPKVKGEAAGAGLAASVDPNMVDWVLEPKKLFELATLLAVCPKRRVGAG